MADSVLERANPSDSANAAKGKGRAKDQEQLRAPAIAEVLTTRSQSIVWSDQVPTPAGAPGLFGVDGSLLAVGNRAGGISLWR